MAAIALLLVFAMLAGLLACIYPFPPFRTRGRAALFVMGSFVAIAVVAPEAKPRVVEPLALVEAPARDWAPAGTLSPQPVPVSREKSVNRNFGLAGNEVPIPRSSPGDRGRYFLISAVKSSGVIKALHKRVGVDSVGWTRTEIDCKAHRIRDIGYSEDGPDKIKSDPTRWYELVPGSSKCDLVLFVCE